MPAKEVSEVLPEVSDVGHRTALATPRYRFAASATSPNPPLLDARIE